ncbi:hypothetical protein J4E91_003667 [Alternaria rosae]|nr:hypothetical protein J4E91_003667 [Alternaria rosae]
MAYTKVASLLAVVGSAKYVNGAMIRAPTPAVTPAPAATAAALAVRDITTIGYWELATDINDPSPLTNYWCDAKTETGGKILMTTPDDVSLSFTPLSRTASGRPSDAPLDVTPSSGNEESNESDKSNKSKKSTPVGAIAGGVVGGVALLVAAVLGVFFLLRRKKKQQNNTTVNNNMHQPPTAPQAPPAGVQYYHEQKPVPQQHMQQMPSPPPQHQQHYGHYDPNAQQPAQQFYDPNAQSAYAAQQGGYAMPEKTPGVVNPMQANPHYADGPVSPVPQYSPAASPPVPATINELPSGRM